MLRLTFQTAGPARPVLVPDTVHAWLVPLDATSASVAELSRWLAPDELERARRFHRPLDDARFTVRRGRLREVIGRYLRLNPAEIRFERLASGQPRIQCPPGGPALEFSVAKSEGLAVFAFRLEQALGVDVERVREGVDVEGIAASQFAAEEAARLMGLAAGLRRQAFFECWTRKEAYVKARGVGLALGLDRFAVTCGPGALPALLRVEPRAPAPSEWEVIPFEPAEGWTGALITRRPLTALVGWRLA